jgi:adenosylcobinamide kinase/adenosylcobinamide-phosphate guanylyltransferase
VATAEALDPEMAGRIEEHRRTRAGNWLVIEEPLEVSRILNEHASEIDCALIDCLTLWVSNLLINRGEEALEDEVRLLIENILKYNCSFIFVTNEVGSGIVPDNLLARRFRDLAGRTNQRISEVADEVIFMVAGIPVAIKSSAE